MSLRLAFVQEALRLRQHPRGADDSMRALCARHGISAKTGYKWLTRFLAAGPDALVDAPRTPRTQPTALWAARPEIVDALLALRLAHPHWGARKLRDALALAEPTHPWGPWPAPSTITRLLHEAELVPPRARRPHATPPCPSGRLHAPGPNAVWTIDYKGEFKTRDGAWCFPLTIVDAHSRYLLACDVHPRVDGARTRRSLERVFAAVGLPAVIRSDNGSPFATASAPARLSRLSVWWLALGITPALGRPQHPEDNGRHERVHGTLQLEALAEPAASRAAQQRCFDRFRHMYNEERPHESLGGVPPSHCYVPSPRALPRTLAPPTYPRDYVTRLVSTTGSITLHSCAVFLTIVLAGETVGLRPELGTPGRYDVFYRTHWLGVVDFRSRQFAKAGDPLERRTARTTDRDSVLPMSSV